MSSTGNSKSSTSETPDKGHPRKILLKLKRYALQKYPIEPIERTEPHGYKPHCKG